jgi:hypothetical protein
MHTAASGGGGRVTSVAALIGICVSSVGAGTYCVATALLPDPKPAVRSEAKPPAKRKPPRDPKLASLPNPAARAVTPTATPAPARRTRNAAARGGKPKPRPHEQAPISPAAPASTQDFSFEQQAADPGPVTPAAAPSTGGGEFEP